MGKDVHVCMCGTPDERKTKQTQMSRVSKFRGEGNMDSYEATSDGLPSNSLVPGRAMLIQEQKVLHAKAKDVRQVSTSIGKGITSLSVINGISAIPI